MDIMEFRTQLDAVIAESDRLAMANAPVRVSLRAFGTTIWNNIDVTPQQPTKNWLLFFREVKRWRDAEAAVAPREAGADTPAFLSSLGDTWCGFTLAIHELREDDEEPACLARVNAQLFMNADDAQRYEALAA